MAVATGEMVQRGWPHEVPSSPSELSLLTEKGCLLANVVPEEDVDPEEDWMSDCSDDYHTALSDFTDLEESFELGSTETVTCVSHDIQSQLSASSTLSKDEGSHYESGFFESSCDSDCDHELWSDEEVTEDRNECTEALWLEFQTKACCNFPFCSDKSDTDISPVVNNTPKLLTFRKKPEILKPISKKADKDVTVNVPQTGKGCGKLHVQFKPDEELVTVHHMVVWNFAYRSCRKGPWEEFARDRERFQRRICEMGKIIEPCLQKRLKKL